MLSGKRRQLRMQEIHSRTKQGAIWKMPGRESENKYRVFSPSHEFMHPALFIIPVGGYSWVYSSQIDGMVAVLCIFIQWTLRHLVHVLAATWLEAFQSEGRKKMHLYNRHDSHRNCPSPPRRRPGLVSPLMFSCISKAACGTAPRLCRPQTWPLLLRSLLLDRFCSNRHCHRGGRGFHAPTWGSHRAQEIPGLRV